MSLLTLVLALAAGVAPLGVHASDPSAPRMRGVTTLAAVQETELFTSLEFTLDSAESTVNEWRYRPASRALRPYVTLQLTVLDDRTVRDVRLGMPPVMMRSMQLFLREPYADFVEAVVPVADQEALHPFLSQLRGDLMGIDRGEFVMRDSTVEGMPQRPTPMYVAFLNAIDRAELALGTTSLRVENLGSGRDSATVLTVAAAADSPAPLAAADWVVPSWDLLGALATRASDHPMIVALDLHESAREGSVVTYRGEGDDSPIEVAIEVGADDRVRAIIMRFPNPALLDIGEMALPTLLTSLVPLVPHGDSAAVSFAAQTAMVAEGSTALPDDLRLIEQLLHGTRDEAQLVLPRSVVTVRRDGKEMLRVRVRQRGE